MVNLWDLRKMTKSMLSFEHGDEIVLKVEWNPINPLLFSSSGLDHKIKIWDLSKAIEEKR